MNKTQLSSSEIQDLINKYVSEQKKLEYQADEVRFTIEQLEEMLDSVRDREQSALSTLKKQGKRGRKPRGRIKLEVVSKEKVNKVKGKRGRPKKAVSEVSVSADKPKVGRKKSVKAEKAGKAVVKTAKTKALKKGGYKLSDWDNYVINSIQVSNKVLITQEIIDFVKAKMTEMGKSVSDEEVKNKVTRSLQKLANRRSDLMKVNFEGKGFAYAVPEWYDEKGKLIKGFKR